MRALIQRLQKKFSNKKVLIVGLGLQGGGVGLAKFFSELSSKVTVTDLKDQQQLSASLSQLQGYSIKYTLGEHKLNDFLETDFVFKGPSVPWDLPELIEASKHNVPIEMEASFFASLVPARLIGVTGTRGKTTTSQMLYSSLKTGEKKVFLAGNITDTSTIDLLKTINKDDIVILELSSWQLSGFHRKRISPQIAVFTNFYPDHLNYYKDEQAYFYDKSAIFNYQKNDDYLIVNSFLQTKLDKEEVKSTIKYFSTKNFPTKLTYLRGEHNYENAAAALMVNQILGRNMTKAAEIIANFKGVAFREELVKQKNNIYFINDSTSTTPTAVVKALDTFNDGRIILILGGNSKRLPFSKLLDKLDLVDYIVLLKGSFTDEILSSLHQKYKNKLSSTYEDLETAIKDAYEQTKTSTKKTYILFSPGATSFAMFANEFERAQAFNQIISRL